VLSAVTLAGFSFRWIVHGADLPLSIRPGRSLQHSVQHQFIPCGIFPADVPPIPIPRPVPRMYGSPRKTRAITVVPVPAQAISKVSQLQAHHPTAFGQTRRARQSVVARLLMGAGFLACCICNIWLDRRLGLRGRLWCERALHLQRGTLL
jgi:hypothetical protein